jgi:hypothetical protein
LESRYALRELEGAIGYDCRRLEDGRRALFRHTLVHRIARRSFLERRDMMAVMGLSYSSLSSFAANPRLEIDASREVVGGARKALLEIAFPYLDFGDDKKPKTYEDYSEYFDELDEIEASKSSGSVGGDTPK